MLCDDLEWDRGGEGGDVGIRRADLCCCMAETNTTVESNYSTIKSKF